jgi:Na+-translocating ferredoxin:NAD+ oxidoreductase RnfD subunit
MEGLLELLWRPLLAIFLLVADPIRTVLGLAIGLLAKPWWMVLPAAAVLTIFGDLVYAGVLDHPVTFNSLLAGFIVSLIAAWTGLSWMGRAPRLTNQGKALKR